MISFSKLGEFGRFGNQLFQYAYLRTSAKRLGVKFYCPTWQGEEVFVLNDEEIRGGMFTPSCVYNEDPYSPGFNEEALRIKDGTEVAGFFQSAKYFSFEDVTRWFSFKEDLFTQVREKYKDIDFTKATALHVRLGDYLNPSTVFYPAKPEYFKKALQTIKPEGEIVVFSENAEMAKKYLGAMPPGSIFIEGNKDYEDFYLMTLCKNFIGSSSSFSWWAAYLNKNTDKKIIMPTRWSLPFCRVKNTTFTLPEWTTLPAHRAFTDNYFVKYFYIKLYKLLKTN